MSYLSSLPIEATEDLSAGQFHAIDVDGTYAQAAGNPIGIQQGKAQSGEDAAAGFSGRSRFRAGAATIVAGAALTVANSGWMITAASGDAVFGRNINSVASGGISEGIFNFANVRLLI